MAGNGGNGTSAIVKELRALREEMSSGLAEVNSGLADLHEDLALVRVGLKDVHKAVEYTNARIANLIDFVGREHRQLKKRVEKLERAAKP